MTHNQMPHPCRNSDEIEPCVVCQAPALVRCPRCARPFCGDHATVNSACPDCELQLARRTERIIAGAVGGYMVAAASATVSLGMANMYVGIVAGAFSVLGGLLVAAMARGLSRRKAEQAWEPVENAMLQVAADGGDPHHRRSVRLAGGRARERDQYTAAYNAGFNRVQGCA